MRRRSKPFLMLSRPYRDAPGPERTVVSCAGRRCAQPIPDLHPNLCEWPETLLCRVWTERAIQWRNKAEALPDRRSVGRG